MLFVGSGFSRPLGYLDWRRLALKAIAEFLPEYPVVAPLAECLRLGALSEVLVFDALKEINEDRVHGIIKRANSITVSKDSLDSHNTLWAIARKIITTNYDTSLEGAHGNIIPICVDHEFELKQNLKKQEWLFKIHGTVDNIRGCVIFSSDYAKLYSTESLATHQLKAIAANNTILFLGFSLKDRYVSTLFENLQRLLTTDVNNDLFIVLEKSAPFAFRFIRRIDIPNYKSLPLLLQELAAIKRATPKEAIRVTRFLRRRCRTFERGSASFNSLVIKAASEEVMEDEFDALEAKVGTLVDSYERCVASAALHENSGNIETMVKVLESARFSGNKELSRLLYLALGLEKLDELRAAIGYYETIIERPVINEFTMSARFNKCICHEKLEEYSHVDFEQFIRSKRKVLFGRERVAHKALSNHLIVCHKLGSQFLYTKELDALLEFEVHNSPKSFVKSFINYLTYKHEAIDRSKYDEILGLANSMSVQARIAGVCKLLKHLDQETLALVKGEALAMVERLYTAAPSYSSRKYIDEFRESV